MVEHLVTDCNGVGLIPAVPGGPGPHFFTDAAGSCGCGASWGRSWFQLQWDDRALPLPIAVKELLPVIIAAALWGPCWRGLRATCHSDNQAVEAVLPSRTCHEDHMMHAPVALPLYARLFAAHSMLDNKTYAPKY